MSAESRLIEAKKVAGTIIRIFETRKEYGDVEEYLDVIRYVVNLADDFHRWSGKIQVNTDIDTHVAAFHELVSTLAHNAKLPRYLLSSRLRRIFDKQKVAIFNSANVVATALGDKKSGRTFPEIGRITEILSEDPEAQQFWETGFQQSLMVPLDKFLQQFQTVYPSISVTQMTQLQYLLDYSNTGMITIRRFASFIKGFGPLSNVMESMEIFKYDWFHGYLSTTEAEGLLKGQESGTFLIRLSKSSCNAFVISCLISPTKPVIHTILIKDNCYSPFIVDDQSGTRQEFPNLLSILHRFSLVLPLQSMISRLGWFYGDVSGTEAGELLTGQPNGTYLLRFSTVANCYAVTHISDKTVKHGLIECLPNGYKLEHSNQVNASLTDTLALSRLLKNPLDGIALLKTPEKMNNPQYGAISASMIGGIGGSPYHGSTEPRSNYETIPMAMMKGLDISPVEDISKVQPVSTPNGVVLMNILPNNYGNLGADGGVPIRNNAESNYSILPSHSTSPPASLSSYPSSSSYPVKISAPASSFYGVIPGATSPNLPTNYGSTGFGKSNSPTLSRVPSQVGSSEVYGTLPSASSVPSKRDTSAPGLIRPPMGASETYGALPSPLTSPQPKPGVNDTYGTLPSALTSPLPIRPSPVPTSPGRPQMGSPNDAYGALPSPVPRPAPPGANDLYGTLPSALPSQHKLTSPTGGIARPASTMYGSPTGLPNNIPGRPAHQVDPSYTVLPSASGAPHGIPSLPNNIPGRPPMESPHANYGSFPAALSMGSPTLPSQPYGALPPAKPLNLDPTSQPYGALPSPTALPISGSYIPTLPAQTYGALPSAMGSPKASDTYGALPSPTSTPNPSKRDTVTMAKPAVSPDQNYGAFPMPKDLQSAIANRKPPAPPGAPLSPPMNLLRRVTSTDGLPPPPTTTTSPRRDLQSISLNNVQSPPLSPPPELKTPPFQSAAARQINGPPSSVAGRSSSSPTINPAARLIAESSVGFRSNSSPESSPHGSPGHSSNLTGYMKKSWKSGAAPSKIPTTDISLSSNRATTMFRSVTSPAPFAGSKMNSRPTSFAPRN